MRKFAKRTFILILATIMLISAAATALAASVSVKTNTDTKIYQSASTSSESITAPKGLKMKMTAVNGNWARVKYKGVTGYCALSALNTTSRYAAYTNDSAYIYEKASSSSDKAKLPVNTKVYVIGKSGSYFRVQNADKSITGYIKSGDLSTKKQKTSSSSSSAKSASYYKSKVVKLNWFGSGQNVLKKGEYGYIYDIRSGKMIRIKRMGGSNHADVEPATASDTAKLKSACGSWSWDSRPVILIDDGKFVACAINTMPHGDQTISGNNYDGQFCLHMVGSKTHGSDCVNSTHQAAINRAYNWAH